MWHVNLSAKRCPRFHSRPLVDLNHVQGLASVMLGRLQSARQASERVLGVLQVSAHLRRIVGGRRGYMKEDTSVGVRQA
jgi:hypothetical protein